jgi:formyltetrahydrofolate deformylase
LGNICQRFDIPFHFVAHKNKTKEIFEGQMLNLIGEYEYDYIVLAKFMRILSPQFIDKLSMRIINIHHSFYPHLLVQILTDKHLSEV